MDIEKIKNQLKLIEQKIKHMQWDIKRNKVLAKTHLLRDLLHARDELIKKLEGTSCQVST